MFSSSAYAEWDTTREANDVYLVYKAPSEDEAIPVIRAFLTSVAQQTNPSPLPSVKQVRTLFFEGLHRGKFDKQCKGFTENTRNFDGAMSGGGETNSGMSKRELAIIVLFVILAIIAMVLVGVGIYRLK